MLEDRTLLSAERAGRARSALGTLRFVLHNLALLLRSEWHRFGYACVNFGTPLSMREYCRSRGIDFHRLAGEERRQAMARLGAELMAAVGAVVPVVPVALVVVEREGLLVPQPREIPLLRYYASSIAHFGAGHWTTG